MEHLGFKLVPIRDAGIAGGGYTGCATMVAPGHPVPIKTVFLLQLIKHHFFLRDPHLQRHSYPGNWGSKIGFGVTIYNDCNEDTLP